MNRRSLLVSVAGAAYGLTGCVSAPGGGDNTGEATKTVTRSETSTVRRTASPTPDPQVPLAQRGKPADICSKDILPVGIVAIVKPTFAQNWSNHNTEAYGELTDDAIVIGLDREEGARAYPVRVLWRHEVVNDDFGGPILVTFCPLCASGMVAKRTIDGKTATFGVSGRLWRPPDAETQQVREEGGIFGASLEKRESMPRPERDQNLVMYDEPTGSYWSQLLARAICGPRRNDRLTFLPSTVETWGDWHANHPDTEVLLPPPYSTAQNPPLPDSSND